MGIITVFVVGDEFLLWAEDGGDDRLKDGAGDALTLAPGFIFAVADEFEVAGGGAELAFTALAGREGDLGAAVFAGDGHIAGEGFGCIVAGGVKEFFNSGAGEAEFVGDHVAGPMLVGEEGDGFHFGFWG